MKRLVATIVLTAVLFPVFCASGTFAGMNVYDSRGTAVTDSVFADYEVTVVNVFTTWCYWCLVEMPDLVEMSTGMPKGTNLMAICADAYEAPEDLKQIIEYFKIGFPVLKMTTKALQGISNITGFPTTFFVDSQGTIIRTAVGVQDYRAILEAILKEKRGV